VPEWATAKAEASTSGESNMPSESNDEARRIYGELFDEVSALLFRHDPIGINFDDNTDEYDPETRTILPRLHECCSDVDVLKVVLEEFRRWFGDDIRKDRANYRQIAADIWDLWSRRTPGG